ncbi:MAG: hypothetical protein LAN63_02215 [Acidobacteriia bacterium]|nr:hypothetical protein [Terriglobia bacterium]
MLQATIATNESSSGSGRLEGGSLADLQISPVATAWVNQVSACSQDWQEARAGREHTIPVSGPVFDRAKHGPWLESIPGRMLLWQSGRTGTAHNGSRSGEV